MSDFLEIKSKHSLAAKYITPELWTKLSGHTTATSGFTLAKAIAEVFDPIIQEYLC